MKTLLSVAFLLLFVGCKVDEEQLQDCANGNQAACKDIGEELTPPADPVIVTSKQDVSALIYNKVCTVKSSNVIQEDLNDLGFSSPKSIDDFIGNEYDMTAKWDSTVSSGNTYTNFQTSPSTGLTFHIAHANDDEEEEITASRHMFKLRAAYGEGTFYMITNSVEAYDDGRVIGTIGWVRSNTGWLQIENHIDMTVTLDCK